MKLISGASRRRPLTMAKKTSQYWYKAYGTSYSNLPWQVSGGVDKSSSGEALEYVLELSKSWPIRQLGTISIYVVDEYGMTGEDPDLVYMDDKGAAPMLPRLPETSHTCEKTAYDVFSEAEWLSSPMETEIFPTVAPRGD
jgi:hypothetical protein